MIQYYAPDIDSTLTLPEEEARHAIKVLRHGTGDLLQAVDGRGNIYEVRLLSTDPRHAAVDIVSATPQPRQWPTRITVAVAPTKNIDRMEWLVEKLTEMGVDEIVPVRCERSERRECRPDRLRRIAVSAMKQSLKATLPAIADMTPLRQFLDSDRSQLRYVAYCDEAVAPRRLLAGVYTPVAESVSILIGPEGDFSPQEITAAIKAGFIPVSLGDTRLRTETAAVAACWAIHIINQTRQCSTI